VRDHVTDGEGSSLLAALVSGCLLRGERRGEPVDAALDEARVRSSAK